MSDGLFYLLIVSLCAAALVFAMHALSGELRCRRTSRQLKEHEDGRRLRLECQHQLKEGFAPVEVSRNLHLPLVLVEREKELMD